MYDVCVCDVYDGGIKALECYDKYKGLYNLEREDVLDEFQKGCPHPSEFEAEMERYERLEAEITELPSQQPLTAAIQLSNGTYVHTYIHKHFTYTYMYTAA